MDITKLEITSRSGIIKPTHVYSAHKNDWIELFEPSNWSENKFEDDSIKNIVIINSKLAFIQFDSDLTNKGFLYKGFFECN